MNYSVSLIILYNKDKKILLQHRTDDTPTDPGKWGLFGGVIENDETPEEAVKRETLEELEYVLNNPKMVYENENEDGVRVGKNYYFIEEYLEKKSLNLQEGQAMDWFFIESIDKLNMNNQDKEALKIIASVI